MSNELLAQAAKAVITTYRKADEASCDSLAWDRLDDSAFRALEEALAAHEALAAVPRPITEAMHVAACKVLTRASGLDGTPQRMLDAMLAAAPQPQQAGEADGAARIALHEWAVSRWRDEVQHRPLVNIHRRSLDDAWRQVIRFAGGDPEAVVGPRHDELLASAPPSRRQEPAGNQVPAAINVVLDAMRADPGYAWSWHCNIAMAFVDEGGDHAMANHAAARFMRLLAGVEPAHELPEKAAPAPQAQAKSEPAAMTDEVREAILEAADEWSNYVVEDTAPRTLRKHFEIALAAIAATQGGGTKA